MARNSRTAPPSDSDLLPRRRRSPVMVAGVSILGAALALSSLGPLMTLFEPAPQPIVTPANDAADALKTLEAALAANPQDETTLISLGNAHYDVGNWEQAVGAYTKALDLNPKNPDILVDMGTALFYQGKAAEAIKAYHRALAEAPEHLNAHMNLGVVYRASGNPAEAKAHWSKALGLTQDPEIQKRLKVLIQSVGG